jgi:hypothetical protein
VAALLWVLLHRSVFGRRVFIVGGNPVTGRLLGIRTDLIVCYLISICVAAIAGLILSGYVGLVDNWPGAAGAAPYPADLASTYWLLNRFCGMPAAENRKSREASSC